MSDYKWINDSSPRSPFPLLLLTVIILVVLLCIRSCVSVDTYNDGICPYCGNHYIYQQAVGHKFWTNYIYQCEYCRNQIEISIYYPPTNN